MEFAFENIGLERVEFRADTRNTRSIQAMKSMGCVEEGQLSGVRISSIILSILKDEWHQSIKDMLLSKIKSI